MAGTIVVHERELQDVRPLWQAAPASIRREIRRRADFAGGFSVVEAFLNRRDALAPDVRFRMAEQIASRIKPKLTVPPDNNPSAKGCSRPSPPSAAPPPATSEASLPRKKSWLARVNWVSCAGESLQTFAPMRDLSWSFRRFGRGNGCHGRRRGRCGFRLPQCQIRAAKCRVLRPGPHDNHLNGVAPHGQLRERQTDSI